MQIEENSLTSISMKAPAFSQFLIAHTLSAAIVHAALVTYVLRRKEKVHNRLYIVMCEP